MTVSRKKGTVSVSIVNYNCACDTMKAARSLLELTKGREFTLYLIDNASDSGEGARLKSLEDERVQVIVSEQNVGYGRGHNLAIMRSECEYHAVVNPDIVFHTDAISALCDWLDGNSDVNMVTTKLFFSDGRPQYTPKRAPTPLRLVARQLDILHKVQNHYLMLDEDLEKVQDIQFCTGCFFVARTQALKKVKGFCSWYFMYFEDADLTRMMLKNGRVCYVPVTSVEHGWERKARKFGWHFYLQLNSMFRYFLRWGVIPPKNKTKRGKR